MEDLNSILITAVLTLIVTILGGLALDYFRKIKPRITYSVKESIPIDLDGKQIGANIVDVRNPSSKTVKDLVIKIRSKRGIIRNNGIETTQGLDYEALENEDTLEIKIPFLKYNDNISITTIIEARGYIPQKPEVAIRSPDTFKLIEQSGKAAANTHKLFGILSSGGLAAMAVIMSLSVLSKLNTINPAGKIKSPIETIELGARRDQAPNLTLAATSAKLPELTEKFAMADSLLYYSQGPYIYSLAQNTSSKGKVDRYSIFLEKAVEFSPVMNSRSRSSIYFFLGKIAQLQNDKERANKWMKASEKEHEEEFKFLVKHFDQTPSE